jgi:hypothetical protein
MGEMGRQVALRGDERSVSALRGGVWY